MVEFLKVRIPLVGRKIEQVSSFNILHSSECRVRVKWTSPAFPGALFTSSLLKQFSDSRKQKNIKSLCDFMFDRSVAALMNMFSRGVSSRTPQWVFHFHTWAGTSEECWPACSGRNVEASRAPDGFWGLLVVPDAQTVEFIMFLVLFCVNWWINRGPGGLCVLTGF